jgi:hypothetical protein
MPSKWFLYDAALKRRVVVHATEHGHRDAGGEFAITETNALRWGMAMLPYFYVKATTISFTGLKKGRHPDAAVLHFVKETREKGLPITR